MNRELQVQTIPGCGDVAEHQLTKIAWLLCNGLKYLRPSNQTATEAQVQDIYQVLDCTAQRP